LILGLCIDHLDRAHSEFVLQVTGTAQVMPLPE
jgi:hypothetical protein